MARTAAEAGKILIEIYEESFGNDMYEKFRIQWQQLRKICAVRRLNHEYLNEMTGELNNHGYSLALFDDFIVVMDESDCSDAMFGGCLSYVLQQGKRSIKHGIVAAINNALRAPVPDVQIDCIIKGTLCLLKPIADDGILILLPHRNIPSALILAANRD